MCSDKNIIKVRIYGAEYPIRSHEDINHIKEVAEYVDRIMRDVDRNVRVDSSLKIAILASLHIANELFQKQDENDKIRTELEDKIKELNSLIDKQLSNGEAV
jgi:cell division protein ZapA